MQTEIHWKFLDFLSLEVNCFSTQVRISDENAPLMPFSSQKDATQRGSIVTDSTPYEVEILWMRSKNGI